MEPHARKMLPFCVRSLCASCALVVGCSGPPHANQPTARSTDWDATPCVFPDEAVRAGIVDETVDLEIRVAADGRAEGVTVVKEPGFGLGAAAIRCAVVRRYLPAVDSDHRPVPGTLKIRIRFRRND